MYDILCTFPLRSDLLDLCIHPTLPLVALALASGHVHVLRLPPTTTTSSTLETVWRVQRHKNGSCRTLTFSHDGKYLISAGYDGIIKIAETKTGRVKAKIAVPRSRKGNVDPPASLCVVNKEMLVLATDGGALHVYEGKVEGLQGARPSRTIRDAHPEAHPTSVSRLREEHQEIETGRFVTTGGGTVAIVHPRKGVVMETEPVEELLLTSAVCCGKVIVGGEEGKLRVWDVGGWDKESIYNVEKGKGAGIDVMACMEDTEDGGALLALGMEDGTIRFVDVGEGKAKNSIKVRPLEIRHGELDGVAGLGWLEDGRLVSGGGQTVKIWESADAVEGAGVADEENGINGVSDDSEAEDETSESGEAESSDEDERPRKRRRKKGKGKGGTSNGILKFSGLD